MIVDYIFGGGLFLTFVAGSIAISYFFLFLPWKRKQMHDYWCHRDNLAPGEDHGNQEPHI